MTNDLVKRISGMDAAGQMQGWQAGDRVRLYRQDGLADDIIRACFTQTITLQPYAPNEEHPACVLTHHSWAKTTDMTNLSALEKRLR